MYLAVAATRQGVATRDARLLSLKGWEALSVNYDSLPESERRSVVMLAERLFNQAVEVVCLADDEYPERLRQMSSPPPFLFYRGRVDQFQMSGIAFSGSRHASAKALAASQLYAGSAVRHGYQVVAGYAVGADTAAHSAAIAAGGATTLVLPEGIRHFRWRESMGASPDALRGTLVVSEFAPNQRWSTGTAMARNRTILSLADLLLITEAGTSGGTLASGRLALRMGMPVVVIDFGRATSDGGRLLIAEGAHAVASIDDFLDVVANASAAASLDHVELQLRIDF